MGTVLIVDGSDVCRAPIVAFTLRDRFSRLGWLSTAEVASRGVDARRGQTMCESAADRLGFTGPAIAFFGAHRAASLTEDDIAGADLVVTAERAQRSAIVRMLPGTQSSVFTWKEALGLSKALVDRRRARELGAPADLTALARALHNARGAVRTIEPPVNTGLFHLRRGAASDPLTIGSGHDGAAKHGSVTQETIDVALALTASLGDLALDPLPWIVPQEATPRPRRLLRRTA